MTTRQPPSIEADEPDIAPTVVRACPAFDRLDELMASGGKTTKDGWTSAAFAAWWTYGTQESA